MSEPELARALREIARRPDPAPDLFGRVADRVRRRRHRQYAVGSAAAVVVLAFGGALAVATRAPAPPPGALATTPSSTAATPRAGTPATPGTGDPSPSGGSPSGGPHTTPGGPARCATGDLAAAFSALEPPQHGGPDLIGGLTVYDKAAQPCKLGGTITLTALDAGGRPLSLNGPTSLPLTEAVLPASNAEYPVGLQISLRSRGALDCPAADRVTPDRFQFTIGSVVVSVRNQAHGAPLWGCRGAIELLAAG
ncbi:hypothetical protein AB0I55_11655 [Actinocatenispora sera]|uniref:hypothetical protein n=1 Tax=Actinocatenispora sera TaxID=390989 RepID=UPI0033E473EC